MHYCLEFSQLTPRLYQAMQTRKIFQIWYAPAGYEELVGGLEPIISTQKPIAKRNFK